ncbi:MAG: hypothetical protein ACE5F1_02955 [Planctomycetota bacterium]
MLASLALLIASRAVWLQGGAPTVFRKLPRGAVMPPLETADLSGEKVTVAAKGEEPCVVAFLKPDQAASRRVLQDLSSLALDPETPAARLVVIAMAGRTKDAWLAIEKGLPRRLTLYTNAFGASRTLGLIVVPSLAVLDAEGRLRSSYVLHEPRLRELLAADLRALEPGKTPLNDREAARRRLYEEMHSNAAALEAAGKLAVALKLRLEQLELGIRPAAVHADIGRLSFCLGEPRSAVRHFKASLSLEKEPPVPLRVWLARAQTEVGEFDEAQSTLEAVLSASKEKWLVHRTLASIAKKRGDLDGALTHLEAAIAALENESSGGKDAPRK